MVVLIFRRKLWLNWPKTCFILLLCLSIMIKNTIFLCNYLILYWYWPIIILLIFLLLKSMVLFLFSSTLWQLTRLLLMTKSFMISNKLFWRYKSIWRRKTLFLMKNLKVSNSLISLVILLISRKILLKLKNSSILLIRFV